MPPEPKNQKPEPGRDAVVTGLGPVSAIGTGAPTFVDNLARGVSGIDEVTAFDVEGLPSQRAAEVLDLDIDQYLRSAKNYLDRNSELGFAACELAVRDAGLDTPAPDADRLGLFMGTQWGNMDALATFTGALIEKGPRLVPPFIFQQAYPNTTASLLSIEYAVRGVNECETGGALTGARALAEAARAVRDGRADTVLAGASDGLTPGIYHGCARAGLLSPSLGEGDEGCAPFGDSANGPVAGEAAAFVVIEEREHAIARGVRPLAQVLGSGQAADVAEAIRRAGADDDVAAVFSTAAGVPAVDARQADALREVFNALPPVVTLAPQTGHCFAAGAALALIAAVGAGRTKTPLPANPHLGDHEAVTLDTGARVLILAADADQAVALVVEIE